MRNTSRATIVPPNPAMPAKSIRAATSLAVRRVSVPECRSRGIHKAAMASVASVTKRLVIAAATAILAS